MKLLDFLNRINNLIIDGCTETAWKCYGSNAKIMDFSNHDNYNLIYDRKTNIIYEINYFDKLSSKLDDNDHLYIWVDPSIKDAVYEAYKTLGDEIDGIYHYVDNVDDIIKIINENHKINNGGNDEQ